ncbi:MAG: glycosyl hydrolase, partial [Phaeodactylibacter sp.]|nr:glycosyl hydrolase [Phaeodactylibacter sp.]
DISETDQNVIYVGGGEKTVRGNVSFGYGVWKSVDAGKTWVPSGLEKTRQIGRVRIHPDNPDIVYVSAMGNLYAPNEERGVYKSTDGGKTWKRTLFVSNEVGALDLILDPNNPRILYATTWRVKRTPYSLSSGGEGSGIWKSTDSGETWVNISENEGLPKGTLGIIGVAVSPVNSDRVWAIVESEKGGVFRSDDAGLTWKKLNDERSLRQRAWYYTQIYADPQDEDKVYVMNVSYHRSKDGGKTFESFNAPHGDHHDLWIAPENPQRMIIGDDGGAQVTYDGGETWTTYHNQPTAQFYRLTTDNHFPYRIYAAQQDNSTIRISHRSGEGSITEDDWEPTAGCECGHIAVDPSDDDIVYGGCYDGFIGRLNHKTQQRRIVSVWPDNPMGHGAENLKYRFQWNFPLMFSLHNPRKLYAASNHVHVSYDGGQSWQVISPDLTRNDPSKLGSSGGPITKDNTSVEYYCTIFALAEQPRQEGIIWAGSDDGLIHLTKDGGETWTNVTPEKFPDNLMINSIEADPFLEGGAYVAGTVYKEGDFRPYIYKTKNFGGYWEKITTGIDEEHFTRVVRADPDRPGLLYAGTESGMYISLDDGTIWQDFQNNLPIVPITDLLIRDKNLIAATQGRGIWIIDDLTPLHQINRRNIFKPFHLFEPLESYRMDGYQAKKTEQAGQNHPGGVMVYYYLSEVKDDSKVELSFLEEDGTLIKTFSNTAEEKSEKLEIKAGGNRFVWNMRYEEAHKFDGMILWWASLDGPKAVPGTYRVRLTVNDKSEEQTFRILRDPRAATTTEDIQVQFNFLRQIQAKVTEAHEAIEEIRDIRGQLEHYSKRLKDRPELAVLLEKAEEIDSMITQVEENLYQTKNRSRQDPLNFPVRLTNKLAHLNSIMSVGDFPPTYQAIELKEELTQLINQELAELARIEEFDLQEFNQMMSDYQVDAVIIKQE